MIKHLLLAVAASATLFTANAADPVVLWEADNAEGVTLSYWNGGITIDHAKCSDFKAGGKIEVTIDKKTIKEDDGCFVKLSYDDQGKWTDLFIFALGNENHETASVTLLQSQVDIMKNHGFAPVGYNVNIHKIVYVPDDIEFDDNVIWVGPKDFAGWGQMDFPAFTFSNAKAGDKLMFKISEANGPYIQLIIGGWVADQILINNDKTPNDYTHPERFTITDSSITVTLTQEEVDKLKATGLVIQAAGFVLNQLLLVPDNTGGTTNLVIDNNDCAVEYYNLQGVRVSNPENGIFIRRQGNKTIKVIK